MKTKNLESFAAPLPEAVGSNQQGDVGFVLALRAGRAPAARFLTLNEEWATMAARALRPQSPRPRPL